MSDLDARSVPGEGTSISPPDWAQNVGNSAAGSIAAAVGLAAADLGPGAGVATILSSAALGATAIPFARLAAKVREELTRKNAVVVEAALQVVDGEPSFFAEQIADNHRLTGLALRVFEIARTTGDPLKLRALGRALGEAVAEHGDKVDDYGLIVRALELLEPPFASALEILETEPLAIHVSLHPDDDPLPGILRGLTVDTWLSCLASLATVGLTRSSPPTVAFAEAGATQWRVTELGLAVLRVIREVRDHSATEAH